MGKRGPKPKTADQLKRMGSNRAYSRAKEEHKTTGKAPRRYEPESPARVPLPRTAKAWRALCSAVPGYDPWLHADGFRFDSKRARAAIDWIEEHCRHIKGELAGQFIRLESFQRAVVGNLFGWVDGDGFRRYRRCLFYVPRKNAKTTLAACIALYIFFEDGEPGAELYAAAAKEKQAKIVWRIARSMIMKEPDLVARLYNGKPYVNSILLDDEETFFQPIASEGKSEHGGSIHLAIIDELHAQGNPDIMEAMRTGVGGRRQPLILLLTTADAVGESVCNDELLYAKTVRDNEGDRDQPGFDATYLPVIYEATVEDDWTDPEVWARVNPLYATSPTIRKTLESECLVAKDQPSYLNAFRRWYLNVQTETATAWLRMDHWTQCDGEPVVVPGSRCFVGVDLSSTTDMTAVVAYFPETFSVLPYYWVPEEAALRRDRANDHWYRRWGGMGVLTLTPGNAIDYEVILAQIDELAGLFKVEKIGMDPAFAMQPALELQKRGHDVEYVRQGWVTMSEPCNQLEVLLARGQLLHGAHPVLSWNAKNVKVEVQKHGSKSPVKPKDAAKIDGIVSLLMAISLSIRSGASKPSLDELLLTTAPLEF